MCGTETSLDTNTFHNVGETLLASLKFSEAYYLQKGVYMQEHYIFFATDEFYQLIRNLGGI